MDPLSICALALGGIGTLVGAASNRESQESANRTNLQAVRETNQANLELYREQFADQYKMWLENNEYNSPAAQVSRLKSAGLNPSLMMQNSGTTGTAQAASVPSANPMIAGHVQPEVFNYSDVAMNLAQMGQAFNQMSQAEGNNLSNQFITRMKNQELVRSMAETKLALQNVKKGSAEESLLKARLTMQKLENRLYSETFDEQKQSRTLQNSLLSANISLATEQAKSAAAETAYKDSLSVLNGIKAKFEPGVLRATIDQLMTQASANSALSRYSDEQANTEVYRQFNEMAKNRGLNLDNEQKKKIMPYIVKSAKAASKSAASDAMWNSWEHGANVIQKMSNSYKNYNPLKLIF